MSKKLIHIIPVFLILAGVIFYTPAITVLAFTNRKNLSERYYSIDGYKNGFVVSYTHSVNKGRVHDYYDCQSNGTLVLDRTIFVSYGAGIPEPEETPGAEFTVTKQGYEISNLQRYVPKLVMAVGIVANHSVAFGKDPDFQGNDVKEYFLTDYFKPQTSLYLETKKISLLEFLTHKLK